MNNLQKEVGIFADDRPVIKEWQTPLRVVRLLFIELTELMDALIEQKDDKEIAGELGDLNFLLNTLANILAMDLDDATYRKMDRNQAKFPVENFQEGDYDEVMPEARRDWDSSKDKEYYNE